MPLIHRKVAVKIAHNFAEQNHEITKYVHPTRLRPGDVEVPLHEISDRQLADLAFLYPDEYLAPCLDKGIAPAVPAEVDDETIPDLDESKPLPSRVVRRPVAPPVVEDKDEDADKAGDDETGDEDDEEQDDELSTIPLDEAQRTFLTLNAVNAIGFISQNKERSAFLGKCYQAEKARVAGARKTVLAAFTAAGVGAEE